MFVWNAMPSITLMISPILRELSVMPAIFSTTSLTTSPPRAATLDASFASSDAVAALSAFCVTVLVSSSMLAAVCCNDAACSSVRLDRSRLPAAISFDATVIVSAELLMRATVAAS